MKNTTNNPKIGNIVIQLIRMGKYIRHKWVNIASCRCYPIMCKSLLSVLQSDLCKTDSNVPIENLSICFLAPANIPLPGDIPLPSLSVKPQGILKKSSAYRKVYKLYSLSGGLEDKPVTAGSLPHILRPLVECEQKKNFLISLPKHMLWVLKRTVSRRRFF